ncbi:hypothetical protein LTR04_001732 [Oleoguttula sp. CCFEE 6159]|nr:hypothetical protein LTR04_001732 [Oleoguttula sp. CCFEE 6159]
MSNDGLLPNGLINHTADGDAVGDEDPGHAILRERWLQSESSIAALFGSGGDELLGQNQETGVAQRSQEDAMAPDFPVPVIPPKKPARMIDEDDYGDDDDEDEDDEISVSPLRARSTALVVTGALPPTSQVSSIPVKPPIDRRSTASSSDQSKTLEDVRKKLEEDKKTAEDAARRSCYTMVYTLESDKAAMDEQKRLDELDRQVETEVSGQASGNANNGPSGAAQQSTLSSADLGASNLTFKHLIARIDAKREKVKATDSQLRTLLSEVRKGRSKWASEEKIGQEELYESADKVLMELKAIPEHAAPFLQRVNKRDAPDYHVVIKHPMDIGTMMKKLKALTYRSKKEFVDDLNLIWSNCLKYNADPNHPVRKKALYMRKETEKLVPLIPDIVVRDRAEVEAEERRLQNGDLDGVEDSDDEEPIMASRGRKAPSKGKKGNNAARKAPAAGSEGTPGPETKPNFQGLRAGASGLRNDFLRADSDAPVEGSQNGLSTPPPGTLTPLGINGNYGSGAPGSQADVTEIDASGNTVNGLGLGPTEDPDQDDLEYKTWKQVTKKDRALVAAERHRLLGGDRLNPEVPALLRTKAGMRRWIRQQKQAVDEGVTGEIKTSVNGKDGEQAAAVETLAEGIEEEEERSLPDYYDPMSAIPKLNERLKWVEDAEGQVIAQSEECLRMVPKGQFTSPESYLTKKIDANMHQMQDTRKICAKIGIVKQMQIQAQTYQNQFQKYDPEPFMEADVGPVVVSDDGPVMFHWLCRAALQRSVGKIFYHAGFEDFQPSALDVATDVASDFFTKLVRTLGIYREAPKADAVYDQVTVEGGQPVLKQRFTTEETVLHCLHENGMDLEVLESYVKDDVERVGTKLGVVHERMKAHLADLLRPALGDHAGADGVGAFNDGSDQFVGGDFAEDIDEDFFGFKELGLAAEFGLESLSVPLHLLQNRMHSVYQAQHTSAITAAGNIIDPPPAYEQVTPRSIESEVSLVKNFFLTKLRANNDEPLIEDEDLPLKQRFPKPRLPPTGKISSPRKRPIREQQQLAKKKRRLEEGKEDAANGISGSGNASGVGKGLGKSIGKIRLEMPRGGKEQGPEPEKDGGDDVGMMSPESITAG